MRECKEGGKDAVEAEEGEEVGCHKQKAAGGGFGAVLVVKA